MIIGDDNDKLIKKQDNSNSLIYYRPTVGNIVPIGINTEEELKQDTRKMNQKTL